MVAVIVLLVIIAICSLVFTANTELRSDLTRTEKHMLKHGDAFDKFSVISDKGLFEPKYDEESVPVKRTIDMINLNKNQLLDNGGWTCLNCGLINASYVGSCGCGCKKGEKPDKQINIDFVEEQKKIKVWICSNCGCKNPQTLDNCAKCGSMRG